VAVEADLADQQADLPPGNPLFLRRGAPHRTGVSRYSPNTVFMVAQISPTVA
jgi:hypothetical protein